MKIPPFLLRRAVHAVRLAMLTSTAVAGAAAAEPAQVEAPARGVEARLLAVRLALAKHDLSALPAEPVGEAETATRIAQWQNGAAWRNSGWRNS
jgi:hypothetical protein